MCHISEFSVRLPHGGGYETKKFEQAAIISTCRYESIISSLFDISILLFVAAHRWRGCIGMPGDVGASRGREIFFINFEYYR